MSGLDKNTCLQCEQTRAEVKLDQTICGIVGGYEYKELEAEWPRHHWRDWSNAELTTFGILAGHFNEYRRARLVDVQYAPCEQTTRGHHPARSTDVDYGLVAGRCVDCGADA